ncbi:MAG TPA: hypothetical protein VN688_03055 [Gemmataceae bacterium]|nr:hypothetical protein [Gemmataceae bacterium]
MPSLNDPVCIHCEQRPAVSVLDLCSVCHAAKNIRVLYLRRRGWTPEWEMHLRHLTARAKQRLPLFPGERPA